jgi:hypothetical protein
VSLYDPVKTLETISSFPEQELSISDISRWETKCTSFQRLNFVVQNVQCETFRIRARKRWKQV